METKVENYSLASDSWDELEVNAINDVIKSNRYTMGSKVRQFENEFSKFFDVKYSLMLNSGSSANLLAIASLIIDEETDLNQGNEVIVPAVSWSTTFSPISQYGLKLRFVDIDLNTLNIDENLIENAITKKTKAIFAVNLLGNSCNFKKLKDLCGKYNLLLLEDNCESLGAKYDNKFTGTIGNVGTFSFFFSHHMQTMEGGMLVTNNKKTYELANSMRAHGWIRDLPDNNSLFKKTGDNFEDSFKFITPGYSIRPLEMSGAIGSVQLRKINNFIDNRRENAKFFNELFKSNENIIIQKETGESSWFGFSIVLKNKLLGKRSEVLKKLSNVNIETRPIVAGNFTKNPTIKYMDHTISGELKNAKYIDENGFFVGNDHRDLKSRILLLHNTINDIL
jgi:CDP-6-deoxy-D-xylo-4-hexulose-3-dehydrase